MFRLIERDLAALIQAARPGEGFGGTSEMLTTSKW
jgi:hypothetical protein